MASEQQIVLLKKIYRLASALLQFDDERHRQNLAEAVSEYHHKYETHSQDSWKAEKGFGY